MLKALTTRTIAILIGAALLLGLIAFALHQWDARRAAKAQARLSTNQAQAVSNSAKDAVNATAAVSARQQASDDLTRTNEKDIRDAEGANAPVDPAVRDAGLRSLCRRPEYNRDPKCVRFAAPR